ncbi:MAG: hypothetical protein IJU27_02090 [Bacteroidales bacterium]|nr:hypothetical protein [Bacteroidales bacterium]
MISTIVYIVGVVLAIWCVLDIFKKPKLGLLGKILVSILVLATSWIGLAVYYFVLRDRL